MATVLDYDIKFLSGVGEKRAGVLARELGIRTFGDLLYYFPFRYVDRTKLFRIGDIGPDAPAYIQVRARVTGMAYEGEGRKRRLRVFVSDGSGTADLVWFSGTKWIEKEQKVLRLRFGLDDGRARTLEEVGKEFNVTRERIRQIEAKALRKLRHPSRSRKLKDYLD